MSNGQLELAAGNIHELFSFNLKEISQPFANPEAAQLHYTPFQGDIFSV
jgi:hypothetical protein